MSDTATQRFEEQRAHLLGLAYRMLGEMATAEDVVQEAWLRWQSVDTAEIRDARAWLSTATIRLSLDALRAARARRETYVGPWLPEPILPDDVRAFSTATPDASAELASDLSLALLHILERLSPEERAAFILHDAFDCDYRDIAATLGKSEVAARKLVSRARERVRHNHPRRNVSREQHLDLLARFARATAEQDTAALRQLFAPGIVFYTDGGGRVTAALNPIFGSEKVERFIFGLARKRSKAEDHPSITVLEINGRPGLLLAFAGKIDSTLDIETDGERIVALYLVRNPDKLSRLESAMEAIAN